MSKHNKSYFILIGAVVLAGGFFSGVSRAADCKVLHDAIQKERVLMQKKVLVDVALKSCPDDPEIAYQNGYILERLRKYEDALDSYKKAISLDSGFAKAYFSIADINTVLNNYEEAVVAYREGLRYDPGDERAKVSLQEVLRKYKGGGVEKVAPEQPQVAAAPVVEDKKVEPQRAVTTATANLAVEPISRLSIPFHQKTTELSPEAQDVLSVVVGQALNREDMRGVKFEVAGHTDNLGDADKNNDIAKKRATVVQKYLTEGFGVGPERLRVASYGQKKPKVPNDSPANQEINRRVDFTKIDQ